MLDRDLEFSRLFSESDQPAGERAPSTLKSRIYSALIAKQQKSGPLEGLTETEAAGHGLCKWEKLIQIAPLGDWKEPFFHCQVCHARVLGEHFENPPIHWSHCPYVKFQKS